jgi:hypothetical protein
MTFPSTTFVSRQTVITTAWAQAVNNLCANIQDSSNVAYGDALVAVKSVATGAVATTQHEVNSRTISAFDFFTAAQKATVLNHTRAVNVTTALQAAFDYAKSVADGETELELLAGDYPIDHLDLTDCNAVTIICKGAVYLTGVSASETRIVHINSIDGDPTTSMRIVGKLGIQCIGGTAYQAGLYARYLTDSDIDISISGAYSVASADLDGCFNNRGSLYASNSTANKTCILMGQNNCNVNELKVRCAGIGSTSGQIGIEAAGSANKLSGDISNCQYGLKIVAARGSIYTFYMEAVKSPITCSGINRGISITGGFYEVLSNSTGMDFSGGTVQGIEISGPRIIGTSGGSVRQAFNWGTACYGLNLHSYDVQDIDTVMSGTILGSSGGLLDQYMGAVQHRSTGVGSWLASWTDALQLATQSSGAALAVDAKLGNKMTVTVTVGTAFTINAPTNPTTGQYLSFTFRNTSGGAMGAITWNAVFRLGAFTNPATGFSRSILFQYDSSQWIEQSRGTVDVPN